MHGMLSAAVLVAVFAAVAVASLYAAVRLFAAGGRRRLTGLGLRPRRLTGLGLRPRRRTDLGEHA